MASIHWGNWTLRRSRRWTIAWSSLSSTLSWLRRCFGSCTFLAGFWRTRSQRLIISSSPRDLKSGLLELGHSSGAIRSRASCHRSSDGLARTVRRSAALRESVKLAPMWRIAGSWAAAVWTARHHDGMHHSLVCSVRVGAKGQRWTWLLWFVAACNVLLTCHDFVSSSCSK